MIKNFEALARTSLRRDALTIIEAAYASIDTKDVIRRLVSVEGDTIRIGELTVGPADIGRLFIIGIGKCAFDAAEALEQILGERITEGIIIDIRGGVLKRLKSYIGSHPLPSDANMKATAAVMALAKNATEKDLVLCVVSGGGSALLCWPHDMKCEALAAITQSLMHAGATIQEMNVVRKHLSDMQGGQLAKLAYPARIVSLIFSDVPGDDVSVVASGPTVLDTTSREDAAGILADYKILEACQLPDCEINETPKEEKYFERVTNILAVSNHVALDAMARAATTLGYSPKIVGADLQGEARELPEKFLSGLKAGTALLGAGETTVVITSEHGDGGRNQEAAIAAASLLGPDQVFAAVASDGEDNGPYAGAIVDATSAVGGDFPQALEHHASTAALKASHDIIETGKTGTNVSDLFIALEALQ